jgi:hypothetical protein
MGFGQTGQATSSSLLEGFNNCMSQCFISISICDCFSHLNCTSCLVSNHSFLNNSFLSWGVGRQHKFMSIQTWSHCHLWWVSYGYVYNTWPLWNCERHWHSLFFFWNRSIWTSRSHEGGIVKALNFIISDIYLFAWLEILLYQLKGSSPIFQLMCLELVEERECQGALNIPYQPQNTTVNSPNSGSLLFPMVNRCIEDGTNWERINPP